jgi:two-component system, OmpR family, sensor kinase
MNTPLHQRLYLRIWLAVVVTIAVVATVAGWLGSQEAERERAQRPGREITIRSLDGEVLGQATARANVVPGRGVEFQVAMKDGNTIVVQLARTPRPSGGPGMGGPGMEPGMGGSPPTAAPGSGGGAGRDRFSPPPRLPFSFFWLMVTLAVAVAVAAYPIVRRLTRRLEAVQAGVQKWGAGDLSFRLPENGRDEVAYLARQFNQSAQQIEALLAQQKSLLASQRSLLANASHELRSPLARIRMGLELLHGTPADGRAALQQEIARSISELDQLIEEILLASRLDAQEVDLGTIEAVDLMALGAEEGARVNAELHAGAPAATTGSNHPDIAVQHPVGMQTYVVHGVSKLLRRALRNLLENARRHARQEVSIHLARDGQQVVLRVQDDGPGVPAAYRERLFEAFFRLPGASERDGGVGLGLALVKSIAARHQGQVSCMARADGASGAVFELRLPAA